jgi:hypothetical protein
MAKVANTDERCGAEGALAGLGNASPAPGDGRGGL